jgi:hypothetical protein
LLGTAARLIKVPQFTSLWNLVLYIHLHTLICDKLIIKTVTVLMCINITKVKTNQNKKTIFKQHTLAFPYGTKLICMRCGIFSKVGSNCFVKKLLESGQRAS